MLMTWATRPAFMLLLAAGFALAGCAAPRPMPESPGEPPERVGDERADGAQTRRAPALAALDERATRAFRAGRFGEAAATLERALDIDSRDASLWLALGWVRLAQGETEQARVLASRARGLTGDPALECRAERLARSRATGRAAIAERADADRECGPARG